MPDDHSICEPPDPIPNSEVKPNSADGSVGFPHVRVGHRQISILKKPPFAAFFLPEIYALIQIQIQTYRLTKQPCW